MSVTKKNLFIGIVVALCFAMSLLSLILVLCNGFLDGDVMSNVTSTQGNQLVVSTTQNSVDFDLLMGTATVASDGSTTQTITANVPANTTLKKVNWSIAFNNENSEWATGEEISDYLTIQSTGNLSATITCHQAFGEQIIITATAADGGGAKATATVDYIKRVEDFSFAVNGAAAEYIGVREDAIIYIDCPSGLDDRKNIFDYFIEYSVGTLTPEIAFNFDMCALSGEPFWSVFQNQLLKDGFSFTDEKYKNPFENCYFDFEKLLTTGIVDSFSFILPEIRNEFKNNPNSDIVNEMQDFDIYVITPSLYQISDMVPQELCVEFEICFDVVHNGIIIQSELYMNFESVIFSVCSHFVTVASSVSLDNPSILF